MENADGTLGMTQPNLHSIEDGGAEVTPRKIVPAQGKLLKGKGKYDAVGQDTTQMDEDGNAGTDNLDKFAFEQMDNTPRDLRRKDDASSRRMRD